MLESTYKIMGKYQGSTEQIDEAESKQEAGRLVKEYQMAYGILWSIWFEKERDNVDQGR